MKNSLIGKEVWVPYLKTEDQYIGIVIFETPKSVTVRGKHSAYKFNQKNGVWKSQNGLRFELVFKDAVECQE